MFCTNCGTQRTGEFCALCGRPFAVPAIDWRNEVRYAVLLYFPEVRDQLAQASCHAKGWTGEQWLDICDKAFKPIAGVSLKTAAAIAGPINAWMGIKTGKSRGAAFALPTGQAIVEVLCAFARHDLPLAEVHQEESGCILDAEMPADLFCLHGKLIVKIHREGAGTKVEASTQIPGQKFDWGKSNRCLDRLFGDLQTAAGKSSAPAAA